MDTNERFEYMAAKFYKETGIMAPGKDDCLMSHDYDERIKKWSDWLEPFYSELFDRDSRTQWINVDIVQPQIDFEVLCSCDDDVEMCIFRHSNDEYWFEHSGSGDTFKATHWQPKPEPAN